MSLDSEISSVDCRSLYVKKIMLISSTGSHYQGKASSKYFSFQIKQKFGNFVVGQGIRK